MLVSKSLQDTSYVTVGSHVLEMKNKMLNSFAYSMKRIIQRCWLLFLKMPRPCCDVWVGLGGDPPPTPQLSGGSVLSPPDSVTASRSCGDFTNNVAKRELLSTFRAAVSLKNSFAAYNIYHNKSWKWLVFIFYLLICKIVHRILKIQNTSFYSTAYAVYEMILLKLGCF